MRMLMIVTMPLEPFNSLVKDGSISSKMQAIKEQVNPEAVYYTEMAGKRTGVYVINMENASQLPSFAEPFFQTFNADVKFHVVMSDDDLQAAEVEKEGQKWK